MTRNEANNIFQLTLLLNAAFDTKDTETYDNGINTLREYCKQSLTPAVKPPICRDCKHFVYGGDNLESKKHLEEYLCGCTFFPTLVSGEPRVCSDARESEKFCGISGKGFEPKEK